MRPLANQSDTAGAPTRQVYLADAIEVYVVDLVDLIQDLDTSDCMSPNASA